MDRRDSELQTRQGEGPETMSMLDSSKPATTGNEDDDKTLANMNIKRNFLALQTNQKTRISYSTGEPILGGAQLEKEPFIYDTLDIGHTELSHPRVTELSDDSEDEEDEGEPFDQSSAEQPQQEEHLLLRGSSCQNLDRHAWAASVPAFTGQAVKQAHALDRTLTNSGRVSAELLSNATTALRDNYMPGAFGDEDVCPHHGPFLSKDRAEPNGEYDHSNILETLLHEMLHAMYTLVKPGDWKPAYIWLRSLVFQWPIHTIYSYIFFSRKVTPESPTGYYSYNSLRSHYRKQPARAMRARLESFIQNFPDGEYNYSGILETLFHERCPSETTCHPGTSFPLATSCPSPTSPHCGHEVYTA
ncbi:MAG: hypothetical protein L6R42_001376 [Xanthoria sp. 1 TBL-2021]|nr:MAG: hypothetical protein L6R42_001376 [Xanthoria sp. 1 TBL-2021]